MPGVRSLVNWEHYVKVHEQDKKESVYGKNKVCPKVTDDHFALGSSAKMRVSYATQVIFNFFVGCLENVILR